MPEPRVKNRLRWLLGMSAAVSLLVALLIVISVISFIKVMDEGWTASRVNESIARGKQLVAALERNRAEVGRYPDRLQTLVPRYLPSIEQPTAGVRQWRYASKPDDCRFHLSFAASRGYPVCFYDDSNGTWYIDQ